jgi:8-oxo-dGTP diphosphatase
MSEDIFHLGIKALIRNEAGEVLLLQVNPKKLRGKNNEYWDLPGGRVQKGHSILDTLKREVAEETGITDILNIREMGMVLSNIRIPLGDNESVGLILGVYECKVSTSAVITISDEHLAYRWFSAGQAAELLRVKYPESFCKLVVKP